MEPSERPQVDDPSERLAQLEALLRSTQDELRQTAREREALLRSLTEVQELHALATERIRSDLALAREIQRSLLPEDAPQWDGVELRCYSSPALEIGGDFYAYRAFAKAKVLLSKYVLAVGDASGKGVSAALLMAAVLARFDASFSKPSRPLGPAERLAHLDKAMMPFTKPRRQSCALCCVEIVGVNTVRPLLRIANAGCIPPYIKRSDGSVEWIRCGGPPLGLGLGAKDGYEEIVTPLAKGDMVVLASDGVVEARDSAEELFGFSRLEAAVAEGPASGTEAMLEHLRSRVAAFLGENEAQDDITLVIARL